MKALKTILKVLCEILLKFTAILTVIFVLIVGVASLMSNRSSVPMFEVDSVIYIGQPTESLNEVFDAHYSQSYRRIPNTATVAKHRVTIYDNGNITLMFVSVTDGKVSKIFNTRTGSHMVQSFRK